METLTGMPWTPPESKRASENETKTIYRDRKRIIRIFRKVRESR